MARTSGRYSGGDGLQVGSRKQAYVHILSYYHPHRVMDSSFWPSGLTNPLTHKGRHFGRVIYTFSNVRAIITNGLSYMAATATDPPLEDHTARFALPYHIVLLSC